MVDPLHVRRTIRFGPPMVFVPILQRREDYHCCTRLPLGYERVEVVKRCPLLVETPPDAKSTE